jgi:TRAF3-interacting protein 1
MSSTGFPKNYFSIAELASKNLKDKASKVAFLNKLVYLVGVCNGKEIDVRPSKIIAGAEPIKTNILLTMFGKVAVNKDNIDHIGAIKHCQFGGAIGDFNRGKKQKKKTNSEDDDDEEETKDIDHDDDDETEERLELAIRRTQHNDGDFVHMEDNKNRTLDASSASKDVPLEDHEGSISDQIAESKEILESEMIREREDKENEEPIDSSSLKNKIQSCDGDPVKARKMLELIVTKPTCKEARLNKPPFKFLHDLVIAINKQSGMGLENIFR